ncbi:hypothetical protein B0H63DRAFT_193573 [Podospora didyma]|uniref:Uncharacterized protein n=1 Tax=Podospora didyma TaxID=330526 RepID=A0AAE0NG40_9PEZI|nr:hypothetical protein B0H63DRAFT_193573 [Podospora didyma]
MQLFLSGETTLFLLLTTLTVFFLFAAGLDVPASDFDVYVQVPRLLKTEKAATSPTAAATLNEPLTITTIILPVKYFALRVGLFSTLSSARLTKIISLSLPPWCERFYSYYSGRLGHVQQHMGMKRRARGRSIVASIQ